MLNKIDPVNIIHLSSEERTTLLIDVLNAYNELSDKYDELLYNYCRCKLSTSEDK